MATKTGNDRFSYGLTFLVIGIFYLLSRIGILAKIPHGEQILSIGGIALTAGIIFVITQPKRLLGWIFLIVGIFLNAQFFFGWITTYSAFIVPAALIIIGLIMVFSSKK